MITIKRHVPEGIIGSFTTIQTNITIEEKNGATYHIKFLDLVNLFYYDNL
ncbi:MAG: hypothetical protein ACOC5F_06075 [Candidatus Aminicenantaceae bacterium]